MRQSSSHQISTQRLVAAALSSLSMSSCFHTVGRISFAGEGRKEAVVQLSAGDVRFAAEVQVRDRGPAIARYDVDLLQRDRVVGHATCDPLRITDRSRSCVYRFGDHDFTCNVVMDCRAHLDAGGPTVVVARLTIPTKAAPSALERADLVIGQ